MTLGSTTSAPLRRLATLVAALFVLSHVMGALHFLVVEHVRCAEHGEWVHAARSGPQLWQAAQARPGAARAQAQLRDDSRGGPEHDHDVCAMGELPAPEPLVNAAGAQAPPHIAHLTHPPQPTQAPQRAALVYALAPKQGPPSVA